MKYVLGIAVLALALAGSYSATAGEGGGPGKPPGDKKHMPPEKLIKFILDHKDDLKLTADQISKLEELEKNPPPKPNHKPDHKPGEKPEGKPDGKPKGEGPGAGGPPDGKGPDGHPILSILTEEQRETLKELLKAEHPDGGGPPGGGGPGGGGPGGKKPKQ